MIRLIEALGYRCLRYTAQRLDDFHVLVGPNASGKSTFLDVVAFLGKLVSDGLEAAVSERTPNFLDLPWRRSGHGFELAVELETPADRRLLIETNVRQTVRYEVRIGLDDETGELGIRAEKVLLKGPFASTDRPVQRMLFPEERPAPETILTRTHVRGTKTLVNKVPGGNDNFYDETGKGWDHAFKLGPRKSALANLPEDETKFSVATWLKGLLTDGVQHLVLNSALMRRPSPSGGPRGVRPDGSNLPWVVDRLRREHPDRHADWCAHLRTVLPDLRDVDSVLRPEDRHRYLTISYQNDLVVPSWAVSDGTMRLLALTLLAYLPDLRGIYLIEEPENGIHPRAVEAMFQSLSSVYGAQILMATHSPVILSVAKPQEVLCFSRSDEGATDIVLGSEHPALREWRGETNLAVLFAGGVLG